MLEINRNKVLALLEELKPLVIGQRIKGFTCGCGCISADGGIATSIHPGGDHYPGQEIDWSLWHVIVTCPETGIVTQRTGLSECISVQEIETLFERHFGNIKAHRLVCDKLRKSYQFPTRGKDRFTENLPAICRARSNEQEMVVQVQWGREQNIAEVFYDLYTTRTSTSFGSAGYQAVVALLGILNPEVILGGPAPVLPEFESIWFGDWATVLEMLKSGTYREIYFSGIGGTSRPDGGILRIDMDITFVK